MPTDTEGDASRCNRSWLQAWLAVVRRIAGMPDYAAYTDHLRRDHPGTPVPSEREFFEQYVVLKYGNGSSRCC